MRLLLLGGNKESFVVSSDKIQGTLKKLIAKKGDVLVDTIDTNTWQSPAFSDWLNQANKYDVIMVCTNSFFEDTDDTPLDIYIWHRLLNPNGKLLLSNNKCSVTENIETTTEEMSMFMLAGENSEQVMQVMKLLFTDSTQYFTRIDQPKEDPWTIIVKWACVDIGNYPLLQRVLSVAPSSIIDIFALTAGFAARTQDGPRGRTAEEILKIISGLGTVDPPELPNTLCTNIRGLDWRRNSCYMDTSLHCMFAVPSVLSHFLLNVELELPIIPVCGVTPALDLINRNRLQEELRYIVDTIRGNSKPKNVVSTADKLRLLFRTCDLGVDRQWWSGSEQEAGEFITWLLSLFPVDFGIAARRSFATNDLGEQSVNKLTRTGTVLNTRESPVVSIYQHDLNSRGKGVTPISAFLTNVEDSGDLGANNLLRAKVQGKEQTFRRSVRIKELIKAPGAIIFNAHRGVGGAMPLQLVGGAAEGWLKTPIDPEEYISLQSGQRFEFSGVILYNGAHYTCCYKCGNIWYYYDDLSERGDLSVPRKIGEYKTLMNGSYANSIRTRGTVYFYNQIQGPKGLPVPMDKVLLGNRKAMDPPRLFTPCGGFSKEKCKLTDRCEWNDYSGVCQAVDNEGQFIFGYGTEQKYGTEIGGEEDSSEEGSEDEEEYFSPKKSSRMMNEGMVIEEDGTPESFIVVSGHAAPTGDTFQVPSKVTIAFSTAEGDIDYIPDDFESTRMQARVALAAEDDMVPGQLYLSQSICPDYELYFDEEGAITHDVFIVQDLEELSENNHQEPLTQEDSGIVVRGMDGRVNNTTLQDIANQYSDATPDGSTVTILALFCRGGGDAPGAEDNFAALVDDQHLDQEQDWQNDPEMWGGGFGGLGEDDLEM